MRLSLSKSKNSTSLYMIKSTWKGGVRSSAVVEKLGTVEELRKKLDGQDPIEWARQYVAEQTRLEKEGIEPVVTAQFSAGKRIEENVRRSYNGGYLFLQKLYAELGLPEVCKEIASRHKLEYNLNSILSRLLYGRILFPASKLSTWEQSGQFFEQPDFALHQVYRALDVLAEESDFIQASVYKNSLKRAKRNTSVLYYDCTNYFFEIEQEEGLKQYGVSKEHRPNPIVQMGLFMDGDGIPLAFEITKGNANEQTTLIPLEQQILSDFHLARFVVCTDAGLASAANRRFNDAPQRGFVTAQPIKKLKSHLKAWALEPTGWSLSAERTGYDLTALSREINAEDPCIASAHPLGDAVFYKERWIKEGDLEQRLLVTFSFQYQAYQRTIRSRQIRRAQEDIGTGRARRAKRNPNDYHRFIGVTHLTPQGEVTKKKAICLNFDLIAAESAFDGFYAVCTNLEDEAAQIISLNKRRWQIEESFRILKTEFKARPVYVRNDNRIKAHFTTCFLALLLFRLLEQTLHNAFPSHEIISCLRDMNFYALANHGFIPTYTRGPLTDALHDAFAFRTDSEILSTKQLKKIFATTKSK